MRDFTIAIVVAVTAAMAVSPGYSEEDAVSTQANSSSDMAAPADRVIIATFTERPERLADLLLLGESLREFGGRFRDAPIRVYLPQHLMPLDPAVADQFRARSMEYRISAAPGDALRFPYARKVFAAAQAEGEAAGHAETLVWLDEDTIVLDEPAQFDLPPGMVLGYRPVMHQNIGSLHDAPIDEFWGRIYDKLAVPAAAVFPMPAVADGTVLRPYFNAGLLVVKPEAEILRQWARDFPVLYQDSVFVDWCGADKRKATFLHQAALTGTILRTVPKAQMTLLPDGYNYPVFFDVLFGANRPFDSLEGVITMRHEGYFQNPAPDWDTRLKGPADRIQWLKAHLGPRS